jgi:hypothetical protein
MTDPKKIVIIADPNGAGKTRIVVRCSSMPI